MKQYIPVWLALTFLAVFLIVFAAFIFTLQRSTELRDELATLEAQSGEVGATAEQLALTTTAQAAVLADAEATRQLLTDALGNNQSDLEDLQADAASAQATIGAQIATQEAVRVQPPHVVIFAPLDQAVADLTQPVEWLYSVTDPQGIAKVDLLLNGALYQSYEAQDRVLFTSEEMITPEAEGDLTFTVVATNTNGVASDPVSVTVEVIDREGRLRALVAEVQQNVETVRGLTATQPITLTIYTKEELRANFEELFGDELSFEDARDDVIELYAFDFVDLDLDLYTILLDLYSEAVLGFYDPDTKELVVVSDDAEISPAEELTLAHEITHALQDQVFGLDLEGNDSEAGFALRSLAEGDATILEEIYVTSGYLSDAEIRELIRSFSSDDQPDLSLVPDFILQSQYFPYIEGAAFVRHLYTSGGVEAINAAWAAPPGSSEQIIHLESYQQGDLPQIVSLPPLTTTLGSDWRYIWEDVLGEFALREYLDQEISEPNSRNAAAGWGGDRYAVYWSEAEQGVVMVLRTRWDTEQDLSEFATAYNEYGSRRYGVPAAAEAERLCWQQADITCMFETGAEVLVVRAPTADIIDRIVAAIRAEP